MPDDIHQMEQAVIISPPRPMRRSSIKNLVAQLPERGKLKIGAKGKMITSKEGNKFQHPIKLDYFRITTLRRRDDGNLERDESMHQRFGDKPTEIPVRLLYDDPSLNFPTRYAAFIGRTLWCSGDGESALRLAKDGKDKFEIACPCGLADPSYQPQRGDPPRCKMNGALSVIIDGASGLGGVWKFRTTSYNSITGIMGAMIFIRQITGGPLANIPLKLRIQPKQATAPTDGSPVLIYVVSLEFDGNVSDLQRMGHQIALDRATTHVSIAEIETEARRMLALAAPANAPLPGDEPEDIVAEFYPEQMAQDDAQPPVRQARPRPEEFAESKTVTDTEQEETRFEVVDFFGESHEYPTEEAALQALVELVGTAKSVRSLDGLIESNPSFAQYPSIIAAYKDQKEALANPGNGQARPGTGAQSPDPARGATSTSTPSPEARAEPPARGGERTARAVQESGEPSANEHPEERQSSTQGERMDTKVAVQPQNTVTASRDDPNSFEVDLEKYTPIGKKTDWAGLATEMVVKIKALTNPADAATDGRFATFHRGTLRNMHAGNKDAWITVGYELNKKYHALTGGEP